MKIFIQNRGLLIFLIPVFAAVIFASDLPVKSNSQPLGKALNPDGTINLKSGYSGSLDPAGYRMVLKRDGTPVFIPRSKPMGIPTAITADDDYWSSQFILPGTDDHVYAVVQSGSNVYIGGMFNLAGNTAAGYIARWDGSSWNGMNGGLDGPCYALAADASGNVYAGGVFYTAGVGAENVSANNIAKWNFSGNTWSAMGTGVDDEVRAIAVNGSDVYAGGYFTTAGGVAAKNIARWDGSEWKLLGSASHNGVNAKVWAIAVTGSDVYAGGDFTQSGYDSISTTSKIARWNTISRRWFDLNTGPTSSTVLTLATDGSTVYAGGDFTTICGTSASHIAKWDISGGTWSVMGTGINGSVNSILISGTSVYAGGNYTSAGGVSANNIARWDGSNWNQLVSASVNGVNSTVLAIAGSSLYVGGTFVTAGSIGASYIARWNAGSTSWENVGPVTANGIMDTGIIYAIVVHGSNVYVGGNFKTVGKITANNVAKWDGSAWSALTHTPNGVNGLDNEVRAIAAWGSNVYVGGTFTTAGGISAQKVARFNGSQWYPLHTGLQGEVDAIAIKDSTHIYAGGYFMTTGEGTTVNCIAKWDGGGWSALGSGVSGGMVYAVAVHDDSVFAGGDFTSPGNHVAKWNGSGWSALGSGTNNTVYSMAMKQDSLLIGGYFTTAGGVSAKRIAMWNGSAWSARGNGFESGVVWSIKVIGNDIYAGGSFTMSGTTTVNGIAKGNGSIWTALGSGVSGGSVYAIGLGSLYIGGDFTMAGAKYSSHFAKYSDASSSVLLETKIFLEGPYNTTSNEMSTSLNTGDYIPFTAPYSEDARTVSSIPANVTDWVLVQLRSTPSGAAVASKSAFLHKDGRVIADDGTTGAISLAVNEGNYYILAKHRNHLAVMSAGTPRLTAGSTALYDFTTASTQFYGTGGAKELETGVWGMYGGNADNSDQDMFASDLAKIKTEILLGSSGYNIADTDMDGDVFPSDYASGKTNMLAGVSSTVPNP